MSENKSEPFKAADFSPSMESNDALQKELEACQQAQKVLEEKLTDHEKEKLRLIAEMRNQQDRLERKARKDVERAARFFIEDLLPCFDGLEQALKASAKTNEQIHSGLLMTREQIVSVLAKHQVRLIEPGHEAFDAHRHEAIATMPSEEHPEGTILQVIQTGYVLHDLVIRPAKVILAAEKVQAPLESDEQTPDTE